MVESLLPSIVSTLVLIVSTLVLIVSTLGLATEKYIEIAVVLVSAKLDSEKHFTESCFAVKNLKYCISSDKNLCNTCTYKIVLVMVYCPSLLTRSL